MTAPADPLSGDHAPGSKPATGQTADREALARQTLIAEARHHRQRYDLYRAKVYGPRPTSETHLRELQRLCESAEARLAAASAARPAQ